MPHILSVFVKEFALIFKVFTKNPIKNCFILNFYFFAMFFNAFLNKQQSGTSVAFFF